MKTIIGVHRVVQDGASALTLVKSQSKANRFLNTRYILLFVLIREIMQFIVIITYQSLYLTNRFCFTNCLAGRQMDYFLCVNPMKGLIQYFSKYWER